MLERQGIEDKDTVDHHAVKQILWTSGFRSSFTLIGASADAFERVGISIPTANLLSNYLKDDQRRPIAKRRRTEEEKLKAFDREHLTSILADETWEDQGMGFAFIGRNQFVDAVERYLNVHLHSPPATQTRDDTSDSDNQRVNPKNDEAVLASTDGQVFFDPDNNVGSFGRHPIPDLIWHS